MTESQNHPSRAQISRAAIRRMHIEMRHLITRGQYKPIGRSGEAMIDALLAINPEIYGSIADPERVELTGLLYVFQRLPKGIEGCRYVTLISREGYEHSSFVPIVPAKRRRNCYRIDDEQMFIEMTRGRSDVYDVLTHLTFMYHEAEKIGRRALSGRNQPNRTWRMLKKIVQHGSIEDPDDQQVAISYLSSLLGRTFDEVSDAVKSFDKASGVHDLFTICYWLGRRSLEETIDSNDREISFSSTLREKLGLHTYGESWAHKIKSYLHERHLLDRKIHVISANMHSVMNSLYGAQALGKLDHDLISLAEVLSDDDNADLRKEVKAYALAHGMTMLHDVSGTNISVQIIDLCHLKSITLDHIDVSSDIRCEDLIIVMDYAFGEQAYETMDELLKPYEFGDQKIQLQVASINIMGKAGILHGKKGDIMIPSAHVFEGSTDNYPFDNQIVVGDFEQSGLDVCEGPMITVLGTSLQNRDILRYFLKSSWGAIGLEMEGAHYQKAIQVASRIRNYIDHDVTLRYAYYASDNPLETGSTLASGSLGLDGVKPTYTITQIILQRILKG
ncbi:MAG: hypothetical protein AAFR14_03325 [Bacteroidota bacterium]